MSNNFITNETSNTGFFVPTTNIWDTNELSDIDVNSDQFKELLVRLYQNINNIAIALNSRQFGQMMNYEVQNGQQWFIQASNAFGNFRPGFFTVVNFGALPSTGTKSVAHGIAFGSPTTYSITRLWAAATKQSTPLMIPIPFVDATGTAANNLQLTCDGTNVNITTGGTDYSLYTICYVVVEYLKF